VNKNNLEQTKKPSNKSTIRSISNADMAGMYIMPAMTSIPSDITLEEKNQIHSESNQGISKS